MTHAHAVVDLNTKNAALINSFPEGKFVKAEHYLSD